MIADILYTLGFSTLASSAAIVAVLLLRKSLRRRFGAQVAYALWSLVPISAAIALLPAPQIAAVPAAMMRMTAPHVTPVAPLIVSMEPTFDVVPWLALAWLLGTSVCVALFAWQQRRFVQALGRLSPNGERIFRAQTSAGCPALIGAWRPRIVLPSDFEQRYDAAQRELILAHEHAHRQRGDAQANSLAAALRCLYWFNPLMHIAAARFRFDQELACDASVLSRYPQARRSYADAMLKTQLAVLGLPAGCHWQSSQPLKERIAMLKQSLPGVARRRIGTVCVAAIVAAASVAAWAAQPAVPAKPAQSVAATPPDAGSAPQNMGISYRRITRIDYPQSAIVSNAEGVVYVGVHLGVDGTVADAKVKSVMPMARTDLADAALAAVKTWTFNPRIVDGKPVASDTTVSVAFSLDPKKPVEVEPGVLDAIRVSPARGNTEQKTQSETVEAVTTPSYRRLTPPKYPKAALDKNMHGVVYVRAQIRANGSVASANAFRIEPPSASLLAAAAVEAVNSWNFNPATKNGVAVEGESIVPVQFLINSDARTAHEPPQIDRPDGALETITVSASRNN